MLNFKKSYQILDLVINQYPALKDEFILIKESNDQYQYCVDTIGHIITIDNSFNENDENNKYLYRYISNNLRNKDYSMLPDYLEIFCLLHEFGHMVDKVQNGFINNKGYDEFKNEVYYSYSEAEEKYREIPAEKFADNFAIKFLEKNIKKLWYIIDPKANPDEVNFWCEL